VYDALQVEQLAGVAPALKQRSSGSSIEISTAASTDVSAVAQQKEPKAAAAATQTVAFSAAAVVAACIESVQPACNRLEAKVSAPFLLKLPSLISFI
jgi:hypothetical protein